MEAQHLMSRLRLLLCLLPLVATPVSAADLAGSADPLNIPRYPYSWIVGYENDESLRPREFALARVEKTRRDLRVEHEVRAPAAREWVTYEMRQGTQTADVVDHYLARIGTAPLFSCRGRDCGRSNLWANEVFRQANLYGPDANQFYLAGEYQGALVALYVIERGNKRVYAHLEVLRPDSQVALSHNNEIIELLAGDGNAVINGVTPARSGELTGAELELLGALSAGLAIFSGQTVYVVCHLYGPEAPELLIERSEHCARAAAAALALDAGPQLIAFGAGPLLPRVGGGSRLELVLPHRLSHQR